MIKVSKVSTILVVFYILVYTQIWGDNHTILYGTSLIAIGGIMMHWLWNNCVDLTYVPFGIWSNLIMVVYCIISGILVAFNYPSLVSSCITYAAFSFVCIAICYISKLERSFNWIYDLLIVIAIFCVFYMLFFGAEWRGYGRTLSRKNNPHSFAAVMFLGIFSVAYKCEKLEIKEYFRSGVLITLFFYGIVECGSRKYLLSSGFLVVIWMIAYSTNIWRKNEKNQRVYVVMAVAAFVMFILYYFINIYSQSFTHARMQNTDDAGNVARIQLYKISFNIFKNSPLVGGGYDQFKYWSSTGGYAHSTYAEAIADFGFIGCIIYFIPILFSSYRIVKKAILERNNPNTKYKTQLMAALCLSELFIGTGQIFFMEFYLFMAWTILYYYDNTSCIKEVIVKKTRFVNEKKKCKYIVE
ncbi:MAG: O-antigen ligase family protein [Clostridiales bacterium]|nr:O-antigen ligase family protein [Clostridiales bacterium]